MKNLILSILVMLSLISVNALAACPECDVAPTDQEETIVAACPECDFAPTEEEVIFAACVYCDGFAPISEDEKALSLFLNNLIADQQPIHNVSTLPNNCNYLAKEVSALPFYQNLAEINSPEAIREEYAGLVNISLNQAEQALYKAFDTLENAESLKKQLRQCQIQPVETFEL